MKGKKSMKKTPHAQIANKDLYLWHLHKLWWKKGKNDASNIFRVKNE